MCLLFVRLSCVRGGSDLTKIIIGGRVMDLELLREVERILIACFGGMSLVLGWDLFRKGILDPSVGHFEKGEWRISLQKVGPGVFFALFGAAVLCFGLVNGANKTKTTTITKVIPTAVDSTQVSSSKVVEKWESYAKGDSRRNRIEDAIKSINTLLYSDYSVDLAHRFAEDSSEDPEASTIQSALVKLERFRDGWLIAQLYDKKVIKTSMAYLDPMKIEDEELRQSVIELRGLCQTDLLDRRHD